MAVCLPIPEHAQNNEYLFRCLDDADRTVFVSFTTEALTNEPVETYVTDPSLEERGDFLAHAILNEVPAHFTETTTKNRDGSTTYRLDLSILNRKADVLRYLQAKTDDWERIETAVETLHTDELIDVLQTLGDTVAKQEDVHDIPREDLESFVTCGWPENRSELLRALEPHGMIGKYLHTTFPLPPPWKERKTLDTDDFATYFENYIWPLGEYLSHSIPDIREDWKSRLFDQSKIEWYRYQTDGDEESFYSSVIEYIFGWLETYLQETKDILQDYPRLKAIADTLPDSHRRLIYLTYGFETGDPVGATTLIREYCPSCTLDDIMYAYRKFLRELVFSSP